MYLACLESPAGLIEIKGTPEVVNSVLFVDEMTVEKTNEGGAVLECKNQLLEYFEGHRKVFSLPFLQEGTAFQQSVWKELDKIPFGSTISYLGLAIKTGDAKAVRAVGAANGQNQLAIIVPCHRVIGSDGSLTGYAGGLSRKKYLLDFEASCSGQQKMFL